MNCWFQNNHFNLGKILSFCLLQFPKLFIYMWSLKFGVSRKTKESNICLLLWHSAFAESCNFHVCDVSFSIVSVVEVLKAPQSPIRWQKSFFFFNIPIVLTHDWLWLHKKLKSRGFALRYMCMFLFYVKE